MIKHRNDNTRIPIKISNVASDYRKNISKSVTAEKQIYVIHAHAQKPIFHTFAAQKCAKTKGISGILMYPEAIILPRVLCKRKYIR